jgi:hypothetical protein
MELDEQIVLDAQISAAILGNLDKRIFVLVDLLAPEPIPDCLYGHGFGYIGVTGVVNGVSRAAFAVEIDDAAVSAIAAHWVQYLAARIMPYMQPPAGDSVQFLERLHALQDTRIG